MVVSQAAVDSCLAYTDEEFANRVVSQLRPEDQDQRNHDVSICSNPLRSK